MYLVGYRKRTLAYEDVLSSDFWTIDDPSYILVDPCKNKARLDTLVLSPPDLFTTLSDSLLFSR